MENDSPILFIEINKSEIIFIVSKKDDSENYEILFKDRIIIKIQSTLHIQIII